MVSTLGGFGSEEQMQRINGEANVVSVTAAKEYGKLLLPTALSLSRCPSVPLFRCSVTSRQENKRLKSGVKKKYLR